MNKIKVLTVRMPWAALIMLGLKNIENRTWTTSYRGKIVIHASAQNHDAEWMGARYMCQKLGVKFPDGDMMLSKTGELLGVVTLSDIAQPFITMSLKMHAWQVEDNYGWVLENPIPFPITLPIKGKLGLWELSDDFQVPDSVKQIISPS